MLLMTSMHEFGGWKSRQNVLQVVSENSEYVEMKIAMKISRYLLTLGNPVRYKYAVCSHGEQKHFFDWEDYCSSDSSDTFNNRRLYINRELLANKDQWHQYDGYVTLKLNENIIKRGFNLIFGRHERSHSFHASMYAEHFCPAWFRSTFSETETTTTPIESVHQLICLYNGLRKAYYVDNRLFPDEKEYGKSFVTWILTPMVESLIRGNTASTSLQIRVVRAICIVLVCGEVDIPLDETNWQRTCKCLLVKGDAHNKTCIELSDVLKYFPEKKPLVQSLQKFLEKVNTFGKNPYWLYGMPLLHFLEGLCNPFDEPTTEWNHADYVPKWWGIAKIEKTVTAFKQDGHNWKFNLRDVLKILQPLFEVDFYLPRTIAACLKPFELREIIAEDVFPVDVCCATICYYIKDSNQITGGLTSTFDVNGEEKTVIECVEKLMKRLRCFAVNEERSEIRWLQAYSIAFDAVKETRFTNRTLKVMYTSHIFLHCASIYKNICRHSDYGEQKIEAIEKKHTEVRTQVINWLMLYEYDKWAERMAERMKVWNYVFVEELQNEDVKHCWNTDMSMTLSNRIQNILQKDVTSAFMHNFSKNIDAYSKPMKDCLNELALKAIGSGSDLEFISLGNTETKKFSAHISEMFLREWRKVKVDGEDVKETQILKMVFTWLPFKQFLKSLYKYEKCRSCLSEECRTNLQVAVTVLRSQAEAIIEGNVTIGILRMIQTNENTFCDIIREIYADDGIFSVLVKKAIGIRIKEVDAFELQADQMKTLLDLCSHCSSVCVNDIQTVLQKQVEMEQYPVSEFCKTSCIDSETNADCFYPEICAFDISDTVYGILEELKMYKASFVFNKMWIDGCNGFREEIHTIDDLVRLLWFPIKERFDVFSKSVRTGDIKFQTFELVIGNAYNDDEKGMFAELLKLNLKDRFARIRLEQLKQFRKLGSCVNGAIVILQFMQQYDLQGDFRSVEDIAHHYATNFSMNSFDQSLINTCSFLEDMTPERAKCLAAYVECKPLVKWLNKTMKKLKELKVFVDLALISAGDDPLMMDKVECLHTAVTGYAPLIFELDPMSDYKDLLERCQVVWKELESNDNLPQMLIDTNKELEWLKDVVKAHGSVEVTSFMQADAINSCGVYTIGKMALENSFKLTVREEAGKRQKRDYTLVQLQDLTSRLMLVAGNTENGNENVENFVMTFDGIMRLCKVYNKLCSAGCVLFHDWSVRCLCDKSKPVALIMQFGQGEDIPTIKGLRSETEDLKDLIPKLAKFMENCLMQWLQHIKDKRKQYIHLNYFTVDQLVILQKELVKVGTDQLPSNLLYPLISAVKKNCSHDDLVEAMIDAKEDISESKHQDEHENNDVQENCEDEKKNIFVEEIVNAGYDLELAIKALDHVDPEDISEGIVWCMTNEDTTEGTENAIGYSDGQAKTEREVSDFRGWSQSGTSFSTMITSSVYKLTKRLDAGSEPLLNKLFTLWQQFLHSVTSNMQDYLSLEHLGLILKHLAAKDSRLIKRSLPPSFSVGEPNLLMCPSADVIVTTLSMYMRDRHQPLPQSDEILLCTDKTTKDEVDIFWRRAIFGRSCKIYCLMNADVLRYDVSEAAERCLDEYLKETHFSKDMNYQLIVICGSDNEYRSTIVSSLDKYKKQPLPINISRVREYVQSKLRTEEDDNIGITPAACIDSERSTVRLIKSWRAGVGKSLFKTRQEEKLLSLNKDIEVRRDIVSIPLHEKTVDMHNIIQKLLEYTHTPSEMTARLYHIDIAHEVENGVDNLLFNLCILECLTDKAGYVWRKSPTDIYLFENMPLLVEETNKRGKELHYVHAMLSILPDLTCRSPKESLNIYKGIGIRPNDFKHSDQLFDTKMFRSPVFQRTFQYLLRLEHNATFEGVHPHVSEGTPEMCLDVLLRYCGIKDPSWSEIHHFVWFLNTQLEAFEKNSFVGPAADQHLPGFGTFLLRFLILMSRDFSTRSLNISEESPGLKHEQVEDDLANFHQVDEEGTENGGNQRDLQQYQMRRTWESSPHPYLFFNSDRETFTFLGFYIDKDTGNLVDKQTETVLEEAIMHQNLYKGLIRNKAPLHEDFDQLERHEKILKLCKVMGIDMEHDPDDTYELTTDNVKKMLAIYMRFRCDIPVIIMGETGCGKTRLIKFMCALQMPPGLQLTNMILVKVHGGTTYDDIKREVGEAERIAQENTEKFGAHMFTVLFFDEANTTEAIGLIKEIMCDKSIDGKKLKLCKNLKIVAACNPYRKHSEKLIKKLEQAGLGYHVDADETTDRLGRVPMRRLVYRVQPLPQSLLPLVWDFGQLNRKVEDLYIRQMVKRYIRDDLLPDVPRLTEVVSAILTASQYYMREQKDECSFVSLRDVDRVLSVMSWFYAQSQGERTLYKLMDAKFDGDDQVDDLTRSLILALGVCYHACLRKRKDYRHYVARYFRQPCELTNGGDQIKNEIECCQDMFLDKVQLENNIARNRALKENVFMMIVCIEQRIPLFLVGKPGSSKSLAKTIVSDAMQGNSAREGLFKELKQAQMVSFQCSPLSTPDGIVSTFKQCAQFQKEKNLQTFVSIVVLDEVGLAEDSPRMPLKTLHPLLEDGCQGDEKPEKYKKVAFIGISNWALDPAKMNRGILVQREVPKLVELKSSARGICKADQGLGNLILPFIEPMAKSYLEIFEKATAQMREFFGLRDFYSLVKMVFRFVEKGKRKPSWHEMMHAIMRNFGGLDGKNVNPIESFRRNFAAVDFGEPSERQPDSTPAGLVEACLFDTYEMNSESRYLLLLTENYGALSIVQQLIMSRSSRPITIFGSSFRSDQEYTQVCRNINKIKICMETGKTVVLLNLENLYESLYDALNQYYVYFGGARYVDLGLGTHRVKCRVHEKFRLIVVAEKQTVYKKFPIPLINRLEKHFLTISTVLSEEQLEMVKDLENWTKQFSAQKLTHYDQRNRNLRLKVEDVFIGYHEDTCSSVILHVFGRNKTSRDDSDFKEKVLKECKAVLLWSATPDAVLRLKNSDLPSEEAAMYKNMYFKIQAHQSYMHYLTHAMNCKGSENQLLVQITTHSNLLNMAHKEKICLSSGIQDDKILMIENLSSFDTEQQFSNKLRHHFKTMENEPNLVVIQCDSGDMNTNLIACARYCVQDELEKMSDSVSTITHVVFIVQLPRNGRFPGFQCGAWQSVHIDDLIPENLQMPAVEDMSGRSAASLLKEAVNGFMENDSRTYEEETCTLYERKSVAERRSEDDIIASMDSLETLGLESRLPFSDESTQVQLNDGILDVKQIDEKSRRIRETKINIKALILSCVQAALSNVKDRNDNTDRETDRVTLILKLLDNKEGTEQSFLRGITMLIVTMLEAKEAEAVFAKSEDWIVFEASNIDSISKTGTLRRSCTRILENKVAPILASIIAFLDTNCNLDLIGSDQSSWKRDLWLAILHSPEALNLQYADLKLRESIEVIVKTTGCDGHIFSACMPFSWSFISQISEIMKVELNHPNDDETGDDSRVESCCRVLEQHPLFILLEEITQGNHNEEIVNIYIQDFVHVVYNPGTAEEHLLVCQALEYAAKKLTNNLKQSLTLSLICVHMAHEELAPRLVYFRAMNSVCPECSSRIIELKQKQPDHFMFQEYEFTFPAVCMLIEMLAPQKSEIDQDQGRVNWLKKVYTYRPVVEKVISLQRNEDFYSAYSIRSLQRARELWSRVVVVKLFLEHICNTDSKSKITVKYCMPLWTTLGEETDMKQMKSFAKVERFLKSCNKGAIKEYVGAEEECSHCERMLEGPPITLPCNDVVCDGCYEDVKALGKYECAKCHQIVPPGFRLERREDEGNFHDKLRDYQKRCNTFFMDVVSQLCFADNCAPSPEVVDRLFGYVFFKTSGQNIRTKDWTIFDTGIDPNPVFRSYLLQLLIRSNKESICENLDTYIEQAKNFIGENPAEQESHCIELSLLIIQCLEDMFTEQANLANENEEVDFVVRSLRSAKVMIDGTNLSASKLYSIANARMGLAKTAKYIARVVESGVSITAVPLKIKRVIEAAQILFEETNAKWTRIYLVKYICRGYGVDIYRTLCRSQAPLLRWIAIKDMNIEKVVEVSDRYVVCGKPYVTIREALTKVVLGEAIDPLTNVLTELLQTAGVKVETLFTLAVHREVTSSYLYPQNQRKLTENVLTTLMTLFAESQMFRNKELLRSLIENQMVPRTLRCEEGEDLLQQGLKCIILHFQSVFLNLDCERTLLQPLRTLMTSPQSCTNWFLPTMPQDDLEDVKVALLAARNQIRGADHNPVFYRCPNGHPYVIGNCGRAVERAYCRECGAEIGGQRHHILAGNTKDMGTDRTETGHILGQAATRGRDPKPERLMTPTSCAIVRCLLHIAMYLGTKENSQGVQNLIKPDIEEYEVEHYLWRHIKIDIDTLCKALNRSTDDVLLFMHLVIDNIFNAHQEDAEVTYEVLQLITKEGRSKWETLFCSRLLQGVLKVTDEALKTSSQFIAKDKRLGADPLLCLLYETDTQTENEHTAELHNMPRVWRYRTTISLQQLRQEVDASSPNKHKVLKLFLEEEHRLRAIRYIPSILHLHRMLLSKYYKKIDKTEASNITFGMLAQEQVAGIETEALLQDFKHFGNTSLISKVLPKDVTSAHLICFDPQHDLLPLLLANCHYSFELGKGTKIEYNLTGLERQLMDRFLFSKSIIDVGRYLMIDTMVYRTEITDAVVFKRLEDKIPQVTLDSTVRTQICNDIRHLPELWQSLTNTDIAISFLKTTGGHPEQNLHAFMTDTLQMESSIPSRKAQQICEFQHIKSLWLLLSLQKAKKMSDSDKGSMSIFESVPPEFHEDISEELLTTFTNYTQSLSIERLTELVEAIHEFILLVVAVKQNMDDSDAMYTTENKISEWLYGYMDSLDNPCIDLEVLGDFPEELLFKHSVKLWMVTYSQLKIKLTRSAERF
ncbi:E3 ubiquitin-protein ligase RNF213-like [Ruditapes philippinarum]|uniref:E3 ubiquitin-protein ligase RNF213-like n=1 Tax=Ruditapes philippinarum TaxID=129788 RepID=UPI00295C098F|nr:E3 ubiquitin-protein ligase RNF213-like [Ruditapes philippinarum]